MSRLFGNNTAPAPVAAPAPVQAPVAAPVAAPTQQGNIPAAPTVVTNPDGTPVVPAVVPAVSETKDETPLAAFKDLWETAPIDPNAPAAPAAYKPPTAEEIQKATAKADFTKNITPEQLAEVTAGGEGAGEALLKLLNTVGQQSLAQSTMVSAKLSEQALTAAIEAEVAKIPALVRAQTVQAHLKDTNPLFNNPAITPVIEATQERLQLKHPNATPAEITEMTQGFITAMGEHFAPKVTEPTGIAADDWSDYLEKG